MNLRLLVKPRDGTGGGGGDASTALDAPVDELPAIPIGMRKIARSTAGGDAPALGAGVDPRAAPSQGQHHID